MARKYQKKRYHEYRGRRKKNNLFLKVIIALLVLILLACLVFLVFLGGRVVYTDDGVRLVLPWRETNPGISDMPEPSDPIIIIEGPEETPSSEPEPVPEPEPEPEPEPMPEVIGAVKVTVNQLLDGTASGIVADAGGNALVVEMKPASGEIYWNSETADASLVAENGEEVAAAVRALAEQDELYLVACVNCFRDQALVNARIGGPLRTSGGNVWYDWYGLCWVSPVSEEVRSYLIRLCLELAEMGFDEILLDCSGYPYFGEVHVLGTNELRPEDRSQPVAQFWQEIKTALAAEQVWMSVLVTPAMVLGTEVNSGITPELLAGYPDRIWVKSSDLPYVEQDCCREFVDRLVISGSASEGQSWSNISAIN